MRIAEYVQVRMHYPRASDAAIEHVRYVLNRAVPHVTRGDLRRARLTAVADVLRWRGEPQELAVFGVGEFIEALDGGRTQVAQVLDQFNLLHRRGQTELLRRRAS